MAEEKITNLSMNITVDDGSRRVPICNTSGEEIGAFTFHPTDMGILQRYDAMVDRFDQVVEPLTGLDEEEVDPANPSYVRALNEATDRLNSAVNELLGSDDAAAAFFGKVNPFSPVDGEFYCARVLNALGQYIGAAFETETAKFSSKAQKYIKKANRK